MTTTDFTLPLPDDRTTTACFTGHRSLPADRLSQIEEKTLHILDVLIAAGYRTFLCGGALGFDTLAEECILARRERVPEIRLILALPCRDQTERWTKMRALREYQRIKGLADEVVYLRDFYTEGCMKERNQYTTASTITAAAAQYRPATRKNYGIICGCRPDRTRATKQEAT